MKVLLVNGSPHKDGCTNEALLEIKKTLEENGIDSEIFWIGIKPLAGCTGCGQCFQSKRCIYDDVVNEFLDKNNIPKNNADALKLFIDAKRIEGCSEKSLNYYRTTLEITLKKVCKDYFLINIYLYYFLNYF